jgi:hypothetical protein
MRPGCACICVCAYAVRMFEDGCKQCVTVAVHECVCVCLCVWLFIIVHVCDWSLCVRSFCCCYAIHCPVSDGDRVPCAELCCLPEPVSQPQSNVTRLKRHTPLAPSVQSVGTAVLHARSCQCDSGAIYGSDMAQPTTAFLAYDIYLVDIKYIRNNQPGAVESCGNDLRHSLAMV